MKHHIATVLRGAVLAPLLLVTSSRVVAQSAEVAPADDELYKARNCFACHRLDRVEYGPAFRSVAAKYASDTTALERLAKKVRAGGGGVWGPDSMPAQTQVTEAEALALVRWILALRADPEDGS